jgi:hypothetical protein
MAVPHMQNLQSSVTRGEIDKAISLEFFARALGTSVIIGQ